MAPRSSSSGLAATGTAGTEGFSGPGFAGSACGGACRRESGTASAVESAPPPQGPSGRQPGGEPTQAGMTSSQGRNGAACCRRALLTARARTECSRRRPSTGGSRTQRGEGLRPPGPQRATSRLAQRAPGNKSRGDRSQRPAASRARSDQQLAQARRARLPSAMRRTSRDSVPGKTPRRAPPRFPVELGQRKNRGATADSGELPRHFGGCEICG
jgi:hypothetical protein